VSFRMIDQYTALETAARVITGMSYRSSPPPGQLLWRLTETAEENYAETVGMIIICVKAQSGNSFGNPVYLTNLFTAAVMASMA
jgi:hypothetical protein